VPGNIVIRSLPPLPSRIVIWFAAKSTSLIRSWQHSRSRHTFASWAVQRGATLQEVKDLLGHHSLAMALRYGHLAPEHLRSAVARLDAVLPAHNTTQDSTQEVASEMERLSK